MKGYLLLMVFVLGSLLPAAAQGQNRTVTGRVTDENKAALAGVSVQVKGNSTIGVSTQADGRYSLSIPANATALVFTFLGKETRELPLRPGSNTYNAIMVSSAIRGEAVVVQAGIMTREAATFTGSTKTATQEQLKETGVTNVLAALSAIDPGFMMVENNLQGSNPNALPTFELNGKTSVNIEELRDQYSVDPNMPLFVIDGFESTLEKVNELDVNRIASMTTLKDAGATAIYGAKGANGVVVIETVKPKAGELMINYNGNIQMSFADLGSYNMMNSAEKLEFEKLTGMYDTSQLPFDDPKNMGGPYWKKLERIQEGVDTYWLKYPIRTGITHQHSLSVSGGDGKLTYMGGLTYNDTQGVMKGSGKQGVGGNVFLQYRAGSLNVSNDMTFDATTSHTGSYGSFQTWANISPYYKPYDEEGKLVENVNWLYNPLASGNLQENGVADYVQNPLYNASLPSDRLGKTTDFTNNTKFEWRIAELGLRFSGGLSLTRATSSTQTYKDAGDLSFRDQPDYTTKGSYSYSTTDKWAWNGNLAAQWIKTIAEYHNFSVMLRAQASNTQTNGTGYSVVGLPAGIFPDPSRAYGYALDSRPSFQHGKSRMVTFMGTFSYNYKSRYLFDATLNKDGSTSFGRENPFTTNWSVGVGWNIMRERFAENWHWINNAKLRASYGTSANQGVNVIASSIYNYAAGLDYFGPAWTLTDLANPWLDWQKTSNLNVGLDASFLDDRLVVTADVFNKITDPTVVSLPQAPSTGASNYKVNMGSIDSKGYTASLAYVIMRRPADRMMFNVRLSAGHTKQEYNGFGAAFDRLSQQWANAMNDSDTEKAQGMLNNNTALRRMKDGSDPDALWAIRSGGIDPATGREIYLDKNGNPTFIYNYDDEVVVGTSRATVHGNIGLTFNYKHFKSSLNFAYSLGGSAFNQALYNKVENISYNSVFNNQDRRALYDRWKNPGDNSEFLSIRRVTTNSRISSRFVQRNNYLQATAINLGWDFYDEPFLQRIGMRNLTTTITMNDLFRLSTIKQERGISYPFARAIRLTLSTSF